MVAFARPLGLRSERLPVVLASVAAGVGGLFLLLASSRFVDSTGYGFDFNCYFRGAERLLHGENLYLPQNLEGPFQHGAPAVYVYAPPLGVLLAPFAALPFDVVALGWLVLHLLAFAAACALMPVRPWIRLASFAVGALSSPLLVDLNLGNVSTFVLLAAVISWRWLDRPLGSVAIAAAIAIRPQLAILPAWWLVRRQWRALVWCVGAGLAIVLATLPFVGVAGYVDFLRVVRNDQVAGVLHNGSLESVAVMLRLPAPLPIVAFVVGFAVAVAAVLLSLRRDRELSYVVALAASLVITPLLWGHYLVLLLVTAAFLAQRGRPWALVLPLLGWLPDSMIAIPAFVALLLPLNAAPRGDENAEPTAVVAPPARRQVLPVGRSGR